MFTPLSFLLPHNNKTVIYYPEKDIYIDGEGNTVDFKDLIYSGWYIKSYKKENGLLIYKLRKLDLI